MQALRIAKAFGQYDVDAFLDDITHEQYMEWCTFTTIEPDGWNAIRIAAVRICYWIAQTCTRKPLKERDFDIVMANNITSPEVEEARLRAFAIQQQVTQDIEAEAQQDDDEG